MAMIIHPFAHFGPILPLIAALPPWLQLYITSMKVSTPLLFLVGIFANIIVLGISIYNCLDNTPNVVLNLRYTPDDDVEELTEFDKDILRVLAHQTDAVPTRAIFGALQENYPNLERAELHHRLQMLLRLRRVQSYTGNIASQKWHLIKVKTI
jgi:hypothetical protein